MYQHILVAYDGSDGAKRALLAAMRLAAGWKREIRVLWIEERLPHYAATVGEMDEEKALQDRYFATLEADALALGRQHEVQVYTAVRVGQAARTITAFAEEQGADLLVIGRTGHSGVWGRFMGSSADKISRHAPCSVLIVH